MTILLAVIGATAQADTQSAKKLYDVIGCNGCERAGIFVVAVREADTEKIVNVRGLPNTTVNDLDTAAQFMLQAVAESSGKGRPIATGIFTPARQPVLDKESHF